MSRVLSNGQRAAALGAGFGMALAGTYGLALSYATVYRLAVDASMPMAALYPAGLEGGFLAVLALDLVLAWVGRPVGWLRRVARGLALAAVAINAGAGLDHGLLAAVMHALPPAILIACVEALRTLLLRLVSPGDPGREPIPKARWLLAPASTAALWRRMALWGQRSYTAALDTDLDRREALFSLRRAYGRRWKRRVPADVVYRLSAGVRIEEAVVRVRRLLADQVAAAEAPRQQGGTIAADERQISGKPLVTPHGSNGHSGIAAPPVGDREHAAGTYLSAVAAGQAMTGAQLGELYGKSERWGRNVIASCR